MCIVSSDEAASSDEAESAAVASLGEASLSLDPHPPPHAIEIAATYERVSRIALQCRGPQISEKSARDVPRVPTERRTLGKRAAIGDRRRLPSDSRRQVGRPRAPTSTALLGGKYVSFARAAPLIHGPRSVAVRA
jgi:hypothetical protein